MKFSFFRPMLLLGFALIAMHQCTDHHSRFEDPPWLGGTNIETLESTGEHTYFLELMDKADYRTSLENQLFTLFVPNDSAFKAYFDGKDIDGISGLTVREAEELFGQHILINPRSREQLMYEYAWGELQDDKGEYGTLFHRKETYAVPQEYNEEVLYNKDFQGQTLKIYRNNTMIPLWTTEFFEDYFGDENGADYLFMYPGSEWSGTQWHDAKVTEAEVRTSSGFIYYLDRVVKPVETMDTYMKSNPDTYGLYYDIAQRFASYTVPKLNENNERVYHKGYEQILDFANEAGPNSGYPSNMLYSFSAFVPSNEALQAFLDETVFKYYNRLEDVPELFMVYLLQAHLNSFLNLPSKMDGDFRNYYGDDLSMDIENDIVDARMCGNGVVYSLNKVMEPNAFTCVPGPVFFNNYYTTFLYALELSGVMNTLTRSDIDVTLFAPSDAELFAYGIRYNEIAGEIVMQIRNSSDSWELMEDIDIKELVEDYVYEGVLDNFTGEGFLRMASNNYMYYNNNQMASGGNKILGEVSDMTKEEEILKNGELFYLSKLLKQPLNAAEYILSQPDLSEFAKLLDEAALIDSIQDKYEEDGIEYPRINFMASIDQWTVFAPTNQAVLDAKAAGFIPEEKSELRDFLYYHFVRENTVFDDGLKSGDFPTHCKDTITEFGVLYKQLNISNSVHSLSLTDIENNLVNITHDDANVLIKNGALHKIDAILHNGELN